MRIPAPLKYGTPYGGRLVWTLPGGNTLSAHLKDKVLIRHKKRWSQVRSRNHPVLLMASPFMGIKSTKSKGNISYKTRSSSKA